MAATAVMGLVIEAMRNWVSSSMAVREAMSA